MTLAAALHAVRPSRVPAALSSRSAHPSSSSVGSSSTTLCSPDTNGEQAVVHLNIADLSKLKCVCNNGVCDRVVHVNMDVLSMKRVRNDEADECSQHISGTEEILDIHARTNNKKSEATSRSRQTYHRSCFFSLSRWFNKQ
jgi:hypothetical protein